MSTGPAGPGVRGIQPVTRRPTRPARATSSMCRTPLPRWRDGDPGSVRGQGNAARAERVRGERAGGNSAASARAEADTGTGRVSRSPRGPPRRRALFHFRSNMPDAIVAEGLVKRYGRLIALDGLDLRVPEGTVTALLGPNGAGKTTTVRVLTTLLVPDAGSATVAGIDVLRDPQALRSRIGASGQYSAVDEYLTGFENLEMVGRLYHLGVKRSKERARELLERFRLTDAADRPVRGYSGGMRRRLDLAGALVSNPPVLFLDEPTTGLDPRARLDLWDVIEELVAGGTTLLLTTQYMDEADRLADAIAVIDH